MKKFISLNFLSFSLIMGILSFHSRPSLAIVGGEATDHPAVHSIHMVQKVEMPFVEKYLIDIGLEVESFNKYRWIVCSGTFISDRVFITAASCLFFLDILEANYPQLIDYGLSYELKKTAFISLDNPHFNNKKKAEKVLIVRDENTRIASNVALVIFPKGTSQEWSKIATLEEMMEIESGDLVAAMGLGMDRIPLTDEDRTKPPFGLFLEEEIYNIAMEAREAGELRERRAEMVIYHVNRGEVLFHKKMITVPQKILLSKEIKDDGQATTSKGDAGGPLFNTQGNIIGIQSGILGCNDYPTMEEHGFKFSPGDELQIVGVSDKSKSAVCAHNGKIYTEFTAITFDPHIYNMIEEKLRSYPGAF